ncbi:MAG TPA: helix-turn-helix transcriptional regulator [Candidatus Eremiobacteraceae bacterium]|nr:helix-turn-helix transcriptional regulator [Candidatus Eremiobacteraceae bacterium]
MPSFESRSIHAKILSTLEAFAESDRFIEDLAYHASESGDAAKTIRYSERAGDAAFSVRALPEALIEYRRALGAANDTDDKARLFERIAAVERVQGHSQEARDALETALSIRLERADINGAASLVASIVGQRYNLGDQGALAFGEGFFLDHRSEMNAPARDQLLVICARVASALYDFRSAERLLAAVSDPAALAPTVRQNWLIVQLMRHSYSGNVLEWKANAEQVDQLLPHLAPEAVVSVEAALAMTGIVLGANEQVERALERAERLEAGWGFRGQRLYALATKASYLFQRGRLQEACACVEELAGNQDFHPARRVGALVAAHLGGALGDDTLWQRFAADVLQEARDHLNDPDCVFIIGAHAGLLARSGALNEAQTDLRAAVGSLSYASPEAMYVLINAARLLPVSELGVVDRLAAAAADQSEIGGATLALIRGTIAHREGRAADAATSGRDAAQRYALLAWPLLEAAAHELAGEESKALELYRRCGADAEVQRLAGIGEARSGHENTLSPREREVAELVAEGLKNTEIAKRLDVGKKTVEKHIASVFDKLGLRSRSQLVGYIAEARKSQSR